MSDVTLLFLPRFTNLTLKKLLSFCTKFRWTQEFCGTIASLPL
ncbi:hypothetical protein [uncultured Corynebacterium sp.]|nr:hypothetical protein [uncultured Corynebacterium sp.]